MDWAGAIRTNREELLAIVTSLFVLAGIRTGRMVAALPRSLRIRILSLLRPAEYAARRLIVMAAREVEVTLRPSGGRGVRTPSSVILVLDPRTHSGDSATPSKMKNIAPSSIIGGGLRLHGVGPRVKPEDDAQCEAPRPAVHTAPGVALPDPLPAFALFDPFKRYGHPWLEDGDQDEERFSRETDRAPDEPVDATQLCRRIRALERALQDLDGQAARLARWRARRDRETCRPKRFSPMRPGRPPGWRKRPKTPVEEVLRECDFLARDAWNTS